MHVPASLRPFAFAGRIFMWVGIVLFLGVGLFSNSPAWAETTACPGQSSIPITPITLFLKYGGAPSTYGVSLCEEPDQPVEITTTLSTDMITVEPMIFTLNSTVTQTVSVAITSTHPADVPFTAVITHSASSADPDFNYGSLNVSQVTAYYSPPVAVDDSAATVHGQSIAIDVLENDIDASGQGLTLTASAIVTQPTNGSASLTISQTIQYTPTAGFSGVDTFAYQVEDGVGNTDIGTVTVCVAEPGAQIEPITLFLKYGGAPSTYGVSLCEEPDQPVEITTTLSTDMITVEPMIFTLNSTVTQTISVAITSTHPADVPFTAVITHSASSADPDFNYGSLNVSQVTAYYSPPVAVDDSAATVHGQSIAINVLANDIDMAGQGIILPANAVVTQPSNGSVSLTISQTIQYTPTAGFSGIDTFTYRVEDGIGNADSATVTVNVAEPGVQNPQIEEVDPETGAEITFETPLGPIVVTVPPLVGLSPSDIVLLTFGEVVTPTGDIDSPPNGFGTFSGLSFNIELFINGEPVQPGQLSAPITISFPLPDEFVEGLDGRRIIIAVWDGTSWITTGVEIVGLTETPAQVASSPNAMSATSLTITTTLFGEFAIFVVDVLFLPTLERTQ
jgi:hypothetical protein